jgi:hypothetical protein
MPHDDGWQPHKVATGYTETSYNCIEQRQAGYLICQLVVEGPEPAQVAAARGVSRSRCSPHSCGALSTSSPCSTRPSPYEGVVETGEERLRAALAGKRH